MNKKIPSLRVRAANHERPRPERQHVLYWMTTARRTEYNFALQHALRWSSDLGVPLIVLEALRCDYEWASDRMHQFVIDGMRDNQRTFSHFGVRYLPYIEDRVSAGRGLVAALSADAALVITDEFPSFFIPHMIRRAGESLPVRLEVVDGNGILPLSSASRPYTTAASFRRHVQKVVLDHITEMPEAEPLAQMDYQGLAAVPRDVQQRWAWVDSHQDPHSDLADISRLPIDHSVSPVQLRGGSVEAKRRLERFINEALPDYQTRRNRTDGDGTSRLSAFLHFGHISCHQVVSSVLTSEGWGVDQVSDRVTGSRSGWWGLSESSESYLDQVITWRELGYTLCAQRPDDYHLFESLPDWAQETLSIHEKDPRPVSYTLEELEGSLTHDPVWNAAQRELVEDGRIHNYLRMLWGKKVLEWSRTPREALQTLIHLNNKYALDGRNPNSWSGIFWTFGRFDRAWGPERPIFGKVRYMSSDNTLRKLKLKAYLRQWGPA